MVPRAQLGGWQPGKHARALAVIPSEAQLRGGHARVGSAF